MNNIEKLKEEHVEWLNEIHKLKDEIKENKIKHNICNNPSMPNVALAPFGNLSKLIQNNNNRLSTIQDELD